MVFSLNIALGIIPNDFENCPVCSLVCFVTSSVLLLDFSLTVMAATLIFISGCGSAISSAKEGKLGFVYNLVKS